MKDEAVKRGLIEIEGPQPLMQKRSFAEVSTRESKFQSNGYMDGKLMRKATA